MKITLLGTGTSVGIPMIGCVCKTCQSTDPRDRRLRTACHVQVGDLSLIIDTGPDFREQMLRAKITQVDAVLWTHHHFDHVMGLDDLRPYFFNCNLPIACFAHHRSVDVLRNLFPYIWGQPRVYPGVLDLKVADDPFEVGSRYGISEVIGVIPIEVLHGRMHVNGYRIGRFAYLTDVSHIPAPAYEDLRGLDLLILDALRPQRHPRHFSLSEAIYAAHKIGAKQTVFTHMSHQVLHARESRHLPDTMHLGYDGMTLDVSES